MNIDDGDDLGLRVHRLLGHTAPISINIVKRTFIATCSAHSTQIGYFLPTPSHKSRIAVPVSTNRQSHHMHHSMHHYAHLLPCHSDQCPWPRRGLISGVASFGSRRCGPSSCPTSSPPPSPAHPAPPSRSAGLCWPTGPLTLSLPTVRPCKAS